jgi:hypothetical protein
VSCCMTGLAGGSSTKCFERRVLQRKKETFSKCAIACLRVAGAQRPVENRARVKCVPLRPHLSYHPLLRSS